MTVATTVFSFEQAVLAAEAGCSYIAPHVRKLEEQLHLESVQL